MKPTPETATYKERSEILALLARESAARGNWRWANMLVDAARQMWLKVKWEVEA